MFAGCERIGHLMVDGGENNGLWISVETGGLFKSDVGKGRETVSQSWILRRKVAEAVCDVELSC